MTPNDVMALIKNKGIPAIDLRFIDLPGLWQHFTVSAKEFDLCAASGQTRIELGQILLTPRREVVEDTNPRAFRDEGANEMGADEPGPAGD